MKSAPEGLDFFLVAADDMAKLCLVKPHLVHPSGWNMLR
jgi:hypothetical protein